MKNSYICIPLLLLRRLRRRCLKLPKQNDRNKSKRIEGGVDSGNDNDEVDDGNGRSGKYTPSQEELRTEEADQCDFMGKFLDRKWKITNKNRL